MYVFTCIMHIFCNAPGPEAYYGGGGGDTGVPISHIPDFLPPNIPYPRFFTPNIPYPRFFTPQYPISQISQSIDHIPDFARLECVYVYIHLAYNW